MTCTNRLNPAQSAFGEKSGRNDMRLRGEMPCPTELLAHIPVCRMARRSENSRFRTVPLKQAFIFYSYFRRLSTPIAGRIPHCVFYMERIYVKTDRGRAFMSAPCTAFQSVSSRLTASVKLMPSVRAIRAKSSNSYFRRTTPQPSESLRCTGP